MRVLVCGGRDYADRDAVYSALDKLHAKVHITLIIEGGQTGADRLARDWAKLRGIEYETEDADWKRYGPAAGPIRNALMLTKHRPEGVVAFPGTKGTPDMCRRAVEAGLKVWKPIKE